MKSVFLTGFPGFLGSELAGRLLARYDGETSIHLLVQGRYWDKAVQRVEALEAEDPANAGRLILYEGDITRADLGLGEMAVRLAGQVTEIYHLAAVDDLGVSRDLAVRVNVQGTDNLLSFAGRCGSGLERFHYVSTCYVSGRYPGVFWEDDLEKGQSFNNYYEETKFLAERLVRRRMEFGLPATIYRPVSITGDSRTGETQKYDGIYYIIQWLVRQPQVAVLPVVGDPARYEANLVPRDFVVDAIAYLSGLEASLGKTYQLCDSHPPLVDEAINILGAAMDRQIVRVQVSKGLMKGVLKSLTWLQKFSGIEPGLIDYFTHPTHYVCENMLDELESTGIQCPSFDSYAGNLVTFVQEHPEISSEAMV